MHRRIGLRRIRRVRPAVPDDEYDPFNPDSPFGDKDCGNCDVGSDDKGEK